MHKRIVKIFITCASMFILVACSSVKNELTDMQEDVIKHVKEPVTQIREDMKEYENVILENPNLSSEEYDEYKEEYTTYLQVEMAEVLDTSKEYLRSYDDLQTEEGQSVFVAYQNTYEAYFELLERNGHFLVALLADELSDEDFDEFERELEKIDSKINEELDELDRLFSTYQDEYDINFVDPLY